MSRDRTANSVSLFPFLAVLVCAMGALIFLLIVTTRRIRSEALAQAQTIQATETRSLPTQEPIPPVLIPTSRPNRHYPAVAETPLRPLKPVLPTAPQAPSLAPWPGTLVLGLADRQAFEFVWQPTRPPEKPQPPADPVAVARFRRLPAPVDPNEALEERLATLLPIWQTQARQLESLRQQQINITENLNSLLARQKKIDEENKQSQATLDSSARAFKDIEQQTIALQKQLAQVDVQIEQTIRARQQASVKYQIVPFNGRTGTNMRPIFIEFTSKGLRFLPENILLTQADFEGFTVSVNPLRAGAQALLNYYREQSRQLGTPEPYLLLIIRPDGSPYFPARRLLTKIDADLGYELVEDDLPLQLPPPDEEAIRACRSAIAKLLNEREQLRSVLAGPSGRGSTNGNGKGVAELRAARAGMSRSLATVDASEFFTINSQNSQQRQAGPSGRTQGGNRGDFPADPALSELGKSSVDQLGSRFAAERQAMRDRERNAATRRSGNGQIPLAPPVPQFPDKAGDTRSPFNRFGNREVNSGVPRATGEPGSSFTRQLEIPGNLETQGSSDIRSTLNGDRALVKSNRSERNLAERNSLTKADQSGQFHESRQDARRQQQGFKQNPPRQPEQQSTRSQSNNIVPRTAQSSSAAQERGNAQRGQTAPQSSRGTGQQGGQTSPSAQPALPDFARLYLRQKFSPNAAIRRRWGFSDPRASIGFERPVTIDISARQIVVQNQYVIQTSRAETQDQLAVWTLEAIERAARDWGHPPTSFYWVPTIRFRVTQDGKRIYQPLQAATDLWDLDSTLNGENK